MLDGAQPCAPSLPVGRACFADSFVCMSKTKKRPLYSTLPWSEGDTRDLIWCIKDRQSVEEVADFLCRSPRTIRAKMKEFGLEEADPPKPFP